MSQPQILPGPYELLELADGQSIDLLVKSFQDGIVTIQPNYPGAPPTKDVNAVRMILADGVATPGLPWYDATANSLVFWIKQVRDLYSERPIHLVIKKVGVAPKARYQVSRIPPTVPPGQPTGSPS